MTLPLRRQPAMGRCTMAYDPTRVLVVMALPEEAQNQFDASGSSLLFTGIGKVNASWSLTRRIAALMATGSGPELVVNFGTAGSGTFDTGSVIACRQFVQNDMDVRALGFELGQTPFEDLPSRLEFPEVFSTLPHGLCASADRFDTGHEGLSREVIDMEAFALAKVCRLESIPFACAKYISDGADHNAASDWQTSLRHAASEFRRLYDALTA